MPAHHTSAPVADVATPEAARMPSGSGEIATAPTRFRVVPAITDAVRDEVYRIRHQVFCEELTLFECRADGLETDLFDAHAVHLLLQERETGESVGCVRVVKGQRDDPDALLPFESVCGRAADNRHFRWSSIPREVIGEVSRLGVISKFRRRPGEASQPIPINVSPTTFEATPNRRLFPYILVSLYLGAYVVAQREGLQYLFTFTELRLRDHLARLGIPMFEAGDLVHHKGLRAPAVIEVSSIADTMTPFVRTLCRQIVQDVEAGYSGMAPGRQSAARKPTPR